MKIYFSGDKSKAICPCCGLVDTTFKYRDVFLTETKKTVEKILVGVCDKCNQTVSTPAQSTPAIKAVREAATESIEAQLPSPYLEVLDLACYKINPDAAHEMRKRLVLFYIHKYATQEFALKKSIQAHIDFSKKISVDSPKKRFSMKVSKKSALEFNKLVSALNKTKTETLKSILAEIKVDILDGEKFLPELRVLSAV